MLVVVSRSLYQPAGPHALRGWGRPRTLIEPSAKCQPIMPGTSTCIKPIRRSQDAKLPKPQAPTAAHGADSDMPRLGVVVARFASGWVIATQRCS